MTETTPSPTARGAADLALEPQVAAAMRERLATVAGETVGVIMVEVPSYAGALSGEMGVNVERAVRMALGGFLKLASGPRGSDPSHPLAATLEGAYALGRGEARSGRSMDALLSAYRVGARVSWRELAATAAQAGLPAATMGRFAELVFAYIDELSAASVAGHTDELSRSGRLRERRLERLGRQLLAGAGPDALAEAADQADWTTPRTLTAVLVAAPQARGVAALLGAATLVVDDLPGLADDAGLVLLLVPDAEGAGRTHLMRVLRGRRSVVGPARPWTLARTSYQRTVRARDVAPAAEQPLDTEEVLPELVLGADADAAADLRARALAPLDGLRPAVAERLAETLRSWLLHQGRREDVARDLHVHAQTVRYRMTQVRELFGDRLEDPRRVLELLVALHSPDRSDD